MSKECKSCGSIHCQDYQNKYRTIEVENKKLDAINNQLEKLNNKKLKEIQNLKQSRDELLDALEEVDLIPIHDLDFNKISEIIQDEKTIKNKEK